MSNYAIIENTLVVNITVADPAYAQSQGWVEAPSGVTIGWSYIDGLFVAPVTPTPTPEEIKAKNKLQAESLLQATDWTEGKSVRDVTRTPHLVNCDEFDDYRVALRAIAVNPPETEITEWPVEPDEQWSTQ